MSMEQHFAPLTIVQRIEMPPQPALENVPAAPIAVDTLTPEQAQAVDQVFAQEPQRVAIVDFLSLAAAGILVHDLVKDTLAAPEEEEEPKPTVEPNKK